MTKKSVLNRMSDDQCRLCGKLIFRSHGTAQRWLRHQAEQQGNGIDAANMAPYRCPINNGYHVGHPGRRVLAQPSKALRDWYALS